MFEKIKIIDLSIPIENTTPEPEPPKVKYNDHKKGAVHLGLGAAAFLNPSAKLEDLTPLFNEKDFPDEMALAVEDLNLDTHAGTHLDAPWHFGPHCQGEHAKTIDEIPLEWCYADGVVLDVRYKKPGDFITLEDIKNALEKINYNIRPYDIVLIMTGADKHLDKKDYFSAHPGMTKEATSWLIEKGVKIIGIDAWGFDRPMVNMFGDYLKTKDKQHLFPAHFAGRTKEYCHIEKMANLDKIPKPYGFKIVCFPVKITKAGAGWVRAVAIIEES